VATVLDRDAEGLTYSIRWAGETRGDSASSITEGVLSFDLAGHSVWSPDDDFTWTWIELLEWLTLNWLRIELEDGQPFDFDPSSAIELRQYVDRVKRDSPKVVSDDADLSLWEFLESHDLNRSLQGATYRSLIVWREGLIGHVLTEQMHIKTSWNHLHSTLGRLGDEVTSRIGQFPAIDERSALALAAWSAREDRSRRDVVAIASGLSDIQVAQVSLTLDAEWDVAGFAIESSELFAAARMTAGLSSGDIVATLGQLTRISKSSTPDLEEVTQRVRRKLDDRDESKPYEQGYVAALALRNASTLTSGHRFDPIAWLGIFGVEYKELSSYVQHRRDRVLGGSAGAAVVVNKAGRHSQSRSGRNASVAHEIAHLLLDRDGALPAAEVLGGRLNPTVEARARAFAAEVLLPRQDAGEELATADAQSVARAVRSLTSRYRVSKELVAWQARNSSIPLDDEVRDYLRGLVVTPSRF
jgi:IrrE N-terminal-like domain